MTDQDEFFTPEEVDAQIERASQFQEGDRTEAEVIAHLRSFYRTETQQESLDRMWKRIRQAAPWGYEDQEQEKELSMEHWQTEDSNLAPPVRPQDLRPPSRLRRQLGVLAAVIVVLVLVGSMALVFSAVHQNGGTSTGHPNSPSSAASGSFKVTSVGMSVTPQSVSGLACGTNVTVTYTATIQVAPNGPGGTVKFNYTVNNGRGETPASISFSPGQTSKAYAFTWSGALPPDHTYPQPGGISVTSPNQLTSQLVGPSGVCAPAPTFQVTSVGMTVSPASIQGLACGTNVTVTYTATIHVAANSPGGTVQFNYTVNNGRGETPASLNFTPGQASNTFAFTWSGALPADHTYPQPGGISVTSPNQLTSALVEPTGQCASTTAAFHVTSITMSVSPGSIQGLACGTNVTVTYTATIHVAPNGPGGTVHFSYTIDNGRGQTSASITFSPGQTTRTYSFKWSGALPADHTSPGPGGIQVTSPNQLTSALVEPTGKCS